MLKIKFTNIQQLTATKALGLVVAMLLGFISSTTALGQDDSGSRLIIDADNVTGFLNFYSDNKSNIKSSINHSLIRLGYGWRFSNGIELGAGANFYYRHISLATSGYRHKESGATFGGSIKFSSIYEDGNDSTVLNMLININNDAHRMPLHMLNDGDFALNVRYTSGLYLGGAGVIVDLAGITSSGSSSSDELDTKFGSRLVFNIDNGVIFPIADAAYINLSLGLDVALAVNTDLDYAESIAMGSGAGVGIIFSTGFGGNINNDTWSLRLDLEAHILSNGKTLFTGSGPDYTASGIKVKSGDAFVFGIKSDYNFGF